MYIAPKYFEFMRCDVKKLWLMCWIIILILSMTSVSGYTKPFIDTRAGGQLSSAMEKYGPDKYAIIYGQFDASPAKQQLSEIMVQKYPYKENWLFGPSDASATHVVDSVPGFYWAFVKPGEYFVYQFHTREPHMLGQALVHKTIPGPNFKPKSLKAGEFSALGSVELIRTAPMTWRSIGSFETNPVPLKEKEILARMAECAKGTAWEKILAEKMSGRVMKASQPQPEKTGESTNKQ